VLSNPKPIENPWAQPRVVHAKRALRRPSIEEQGDIKHEQGNDKISSAPEELAGSVSVEPCDSPWEQTSVVHAKRGLRSPSVEHSEEEKEEGQSEHERRGDKEDGNDGDWSDVLYVCMCVCVLCISEPVCVSVLLFVAVYVSVSVFVHLPCTYARK